MTTRIPVLLRGVAWPAVTGLTICALVFGGGGAGLGRNPNSPALLATAFALLGAAAAVTLDEPAGAVVDVTPTGPSRRAAARAWALSAPLAVGLIVVAATSLRNAGLADAALVVALLGNVLTGFALACVGRRRTNEPGPWAATAVVLVLVLLPALGPVSSRVHTIPTYAPSDGLSSTTWWSMAIALSVMTIAAATGGASRLGLRPGGRRSRLRPDHPDPMSRSRDPDRVAAPARAALSERPGLAGRS